MISQLAQLPLPIIILISKSKSYIRALPKIDLLTRI